MTSEKKKLGLIEGWLSAGINIILFALKLWAGIRCGSVAMIADAWHTLSDTLSSIVVIFGFCISEKPADEKHPFGHGRAEVIGAIVISTLLGMVGVKFFLEAIGQLSDYQKVNFNRTAIGIFFISVLVKESLARFSMWASRKTDSKSLRADGWHHRSDAIASGLIVLGAIAGRDLWWIDGVLGLFVSMLLFKATYDIFRDTSDILLGEKADQDLADKIKQTIYKQIGQTLDLHHIHIHRYGRHKEVTFHLCFPGEATLQDAHAKALQIENALKRHLNIEATIHLDPGDTSN